MLFKIPWQDTKATRIAANIWESLFKAGQTGLLKQIHSSTHLWDSHTNIKSTNINKIICSRTSKHCCQAILTLTKDLTLNVKMNSDCSDNSLCCFETLTLNTFPTLTFTYVSNYRLHPVRLDLTENTLDAAFAASRDSA